YQVKKARCKTLSFCNAPFAGEKGDSNSHISHIDTFMAKRFAIIFISTGAIGNLRLPSLCVC
ncbi:MAG TPA: hypothetical protein PL044_09715, partial [Clostridiales bacterium]|nr:hypothetical protein [Clostridiales bacterium]HQK74029.1 hypothetical protein [Clostridiales bacterium]